jgi:hypothetical protein
MKSSLTIALWLVTAALAGSIIQYKGFNWGYAWGYSDGRSDRLCQPAPGELVIPTPPYWRRS